MTGIRTMNKGRLFVISGPSGAGKSSVISLVTQGRTDIYFSISMTTRPRAQAETDGVEYHFITKERFLEMIGDGDFLEYDRHMDSYYGTPREPVIRMLDAGYNVILDIDVRGAEQIREAMPDAVTIFIKPPSVEELEKRLRLRKRDSEEQLKLRMQRAEYELSREDEFDYVIINDDLGTVSKELDRILAGNAGVK